MFPWTAMFSLEPKVPGQRTSEELVTNTLMLELGAMVKRTERVCLERANEVRRRRSSSSSVDYSWLATAPLKAPFELTPGDVLELQELCAKVPPSLCGPIIARFRKLVTQMEPEVHDVPRLFRTVLLNGLEELENDAELQARAHRWDKQRSTSLSFETFRSRFRSTRGVGGFLGGSRGNLQEHIWPDEEEEDAAEKVVVAKGMRRNRSKSMPDITPMTGAH